MHDDNINRTTVLHSPLAYLQGSLCRPSAFTQRPSENRNNENSHSSLPPLFCSEHEHRYYKASAANPILQLRGLRPGKISSLVDVSAGRVKLLTWAHLHLELGWFHGGQLPLNRVVFASPCGETGGRGGSLVVGRGSGFQDKPTF